MLTRTLRSYASGASSQSVRRYLSLMQARGRQILLNLHELLKLRRQILGIVGLGDLLRLRLGIIGAVLRIDVLRLLGGRRRRILSRSYRNLLVSWLRRCLADLNFRLILRYLALGYNLGLNGLGQ